MTPELMTAVLLDANPDELPELLRALPLFIQYGMEEEEAGEWALRILALIEYHETGDEADVA